MFEIARLTAEIEGNDVVQFEVGGAIRRCSKRARVFPSAKADRSLSGMAMEMTPRRMKVEQVLSGARLERAATYRRRGLGRI